MENETYNLIMTYGAEWLINAFTGLGGIVTVASFIIKLTPTKKDDNFIAKHSKQLNFIERFSVFRK